MSYEVGKKESVDDTLLSALEKVELAARRAAANPNISSSDALSVFADEIAKLLKEKRKGIGFLTEEEE